MTFRCLFSMYGLTMLYIMICSIFPVAAMERQKTIFSQVSEHTLRSGSIIDKEILASEVNRSFMQYNHAAIRISWLQEDYRQLALDMRNELVNRGVPISAIQMQARPLQDHRLISGLVNIVVEHYQLPLYTCNYHRQDYRYRDRDKIGCSLDNIRRLSIVN